MKRNPRIPVKALALTTAINAAITANKSSFKPGNTMTEQEFLAIAATIPELNAPSYRTSVLSLKEANKYTLAKVTCYTKFNKVLALRGIVCKSKNYYTSFEVVPVARVSNEVERISDRAVTCANSAAILRTGATNFHSKFTKLKSSELLRVSAYISRG